MAAVGSYVLVFTAGPVTALATGLGALPFFVVEGVGDRWNVVLWGVASGITVVAPVLDLAVEGVTAARAIGGEVGFGALAAGVVAGVLVVVVGHELASTVEIHPREYEEADVREPLVVLGC